MKAFIHKLYVMCSKVVYEYSNKKHFFCKPKAFWFALCPYLKKYGKSRHKAILAYLGREEAGLIEKYRNAVCENKQSVCISDDCPIWVMWWQGVNYPPVVKLCLNSISQNKGNHPLYILDKTNYKEYITLPNGLEEKLLKANRLAHLSDIIRFGLLSKHGGIWLDATIFVSQPITGWKLPLYSIRHRKGNPRYVLDGWRWSSFMFASLPNEVLPTFVYEALLDYFSKHNDLIDYFLTDYLIAIIYLNNHYVRKEIDSLPTDNTDTLELLMNLPQPYNEIWLQSCLQKRCFHKLDWRVKIESPDSILAHLIKINE